jgi:hypothetical protein
LRDGDEYTFPYSVNILLKFARKTYEIGTAGKWSKGSDSLEIEDATALYKIIQRSVLKILGRHNH